MMSFPFNWQHKPVLTSSSSCNFDFCVLLRGSFVIPVSYIYIYIYIYITVILVGDF